MEYFIITLLLLCIIVNAINYKKINNLNNTLQNGSYQSGKMTIKANDLIATNNKGRQRGR